MCVSVVVQFYPWFKFYFPLFWGMVMHGNQLKTKGNKHYTKDKTNQFRYIKIHTCSETEGDKTKENVLFITEPQGDFFCFIPQASQPSSNFNISELVY